MRRLGLCLVELKRQGIKCRSKTTDSIVCEKSKGTNGGEGHMLAPGASIGFSFCFHISRMGMWLTASAEDRWDRSCWDEGRAQECFHHYRHLERFSLARLSFQTFFVMQTYLDATVQYPRTHQGREELWTAYWNSWLLWNDRKGCASRRSNEIRQMYKTRITMSNRYRLVQQKQ